MTLNELRMNTIITAENGKYLALKNAENSEELIGKPVRIIFDNTGIVPEFEEREVTE